MENTKQQNTWVLILNMEGKGKESAFVRKCYSRKFIHHRIMLINKKHSAAPKTNRWLLNSSTIIDHTKNHPIKENVPTRGILTQFPWTNPQKLKFRRGWSEVEWEGITSWSFSALFLRGIFCDAMTMIHIAITWGGISCLLLLTVNLQCKSVQGSCSQCGVTAWQYPLVPSTQWFKTSINVNLLGEVINSRKPPQWFNKLPF